MRARDGRTPRARKPRKSWGQLSERTRREKLRYYETNFGLDRDQVGKRYNRGTLGPQTGARGKLKPGVVPDDIRRHPERYQKLGPGAGGIVVLRDQVIEHLYGLEDLTEDIKFNRFNVLQNITAMTEAELVLALSLDAEAWRDMAARKPARNRKKNPFWYH